MPVTEKSPIISLQNVGCHFKVRHGLMRYRLHEALNDVSFDLHRGETLGLIGKNGAGKSTLLRLLSRILLPNSGRIVFHENLSVSLLTLQLGFSPELTGRDNAIMGAMMLGYSKQEARDRLGTITKFSELQDWIDEPIKTYSTGMKARLGFAVAMELSPDVLLIDEVLGVGDESFRKKSSMLMKERMKSGQTVVFVSHQMDAVLNLCSTVVWIEHGATRMIGEPREVVKEYRKWIT